MNKRSTIVVAVSLLCFCFSFHQTFAQDGTLDASFGSSGKVWNPEANFKVKSTNDDPYIGNPRILVLSDGKILHITATPTGNILIRYLANGDLDLTFGSGGMITLPATTGLQNIHDAELLPGDQVLLAGDVVSGSNRKFALMRLNADGSRDNSFDGDGLVTTTAGTANSVARGIAVQTDGKIVATGEAMEGADGLFVTVRYLPDGTPDPAFDGDGIVYINPSPVIEYSTAVTIQTDDKILIAGTTWRFVFIGPNGFFNGYVQEACVIRYLPNGSMDNSFGTNGKITTTTFDGSELVKDILVQPDGKIIVSGKGEIQSDPDNQWIFANRYNSNGTPDAGFNGTGSASLRVSAIIATEMEIQADGKILLSAFDACFSSLCGDPSIGGMIVRRLLSNGTEDPSFSTILKLGISYIDGPNGSKEFGSSIASQGNQLIVGGTARYPAFGTHKAFLVRLNNSSPLLPHSPVKYYQDQDGDGFGNDAVTITGYQQPSGYVTKGSDCDDAHNMVYPGATEISDGLDNNCNGEVDENLSNEYLTIPALIQAEDWTAIQGVQNESTGDEGSGQNVGYIDYGDWMDYKIHVPQAGSYRLTFRLASPSSSNPRFELRLGSSVLSVIDVPNTGGFQTYTNVVIDVTLPQGNHTIRLLSTGGGYWNINWMKFEIPGGTYTTIPAHIEAENWSAMQGVQTESTSDAGGGLNVGYIDYVDWMDFQIHVPQTRSYQLYLRLATPSTNNPQFEIRDGSELLATVNVPNTGGFQNWQTIMVPVQLSAGNHTIRLLSTGGGYWNINWLRFELPTFTVHSDFFEPMFELKNLSPESSMMISPNPVSDQLNLELQNELQGSVRVELTALTGQVLKTFVLNKTSKINRYPLSLNGITSGTYLIRVTMKGYSETKKLIRL